MRAHGVHVYDARMPVVHPCGLPPHVSLLALPSIRVDWRTATTPHHAGVNVQSIQREVSLVHGAVVHTGSEVLYQGNATVAAAQQVSV